MCEMHQCRDCERQIPAHIPCCIYCKGKLKAQGICWYCGERPVKPAKPGKQQSQYCAECQPLSKKLLPPFVHERTLDWHGTEARGRRHRSSQQAAHLPEDS